MYAFCLDQEKRFILRLNVCVVEQNIDLSILKTNIRYDKIRILNVVRLSRLQRRRRICEPYNSNGNHFFLDFFSSVRILPRDRNVFFFFWVYCERKLEIPVLTRFFNQTQNSSVSFWHEKCTKIRKPSPACDLTSNRLRV